MIRKIGLLCAAASIACVPAVHAAEQPPSAYVRCDGKPNNMTDGELAARLVALSLVVGLLMPQPEGVDYAKREKGAAGIRACDAAIDGDAVSKRGGEGNVERKLELVLARAVHRIEEKQFDAAIAEARQLDAMAGPLAEASGYRRSLALSALEIQAGALLMSGKDAEAEQMALAMAAQSPLDLHNQLRAIMYLRTDDRVTDQERDYFDNLVRLSPSMLPLRMSHRLWAGDYLGAAADSVVLEKFAEALSEKPEELDLSPGPIASRAVYHIMANDVAQARALATKARADLERYAASMEGARKPERIAVIVETLDFYDVALRLHEGRVAEARSAFAGRSIWSSVDVVVVADLLGRLRKDAKPAELVGPLAETPEAMRAKEVERRRKLQLAEPNMTNRMFASVRGLIKPTSYDGALRNVWRTDKSKFVRKERLAGTAYEGVVVTGTYGVPAGEALLLHSALIAKSRGKAGFALGPIRKRLDTALVVFANPGDRGAPAEIFLNADQVIATLAPRMPQPVTKR